MTTVSESLSTYLGVADPRVSLVGRPGGMRQLLVDGEPAYQVSIDCGTCGYLLSRQIGSNDVRSFGEFPDRLGNGLTALDGDVVEAFGQALPKGEYRVSLTEVTPTLVRPGSAEDYFTHEMVDSWGMEPPLGIPHWPGTPYYRIGTTPFTWRRTRKGQAPDLDWKSALFEMLVPFSGLMDFDPSRLKAFRAAVAGGVKPTAVAVSVLDIEKWAVALVDQPALDAHWIWTHFLLDGHHKTYAASIEGRPLTLLTFTMVERGLSSVEELDQVFEIVNGASQVSTPLMIGRPTAR